MGPATELVVDVDSANRRLLAAGSSSRTSPCLVVRCRSTVTGASQVDLRVEVDGAVVMVWTTPPDGV